MGMTDTTYSAIDTLDTFACQIWVEPGRCRATVTPRGELDLATVPWLEHQLRALSADDVATLVLDLGELSFMDSSGLHLLLRSAAQAERDGTRFLLHEGAGPAARLLALTNLTHHFAAA